ncbi:MAG TPA: hypothetical protein VHS13_08565 [Edaphobacter sp.]|jgi:hypothetical protein|nr:hypothetical protein [Edaphobacter sp.]
MAEPKSKAFGGLGGGVVTTAIGVYLGNNAHPHLAQGLYISAGLCGVYAVMQWPVIHRMFGLQLISKEEPPQITSENKSTTGGDFNGLQLSGLTGSSIFMGDSALSKLRPPQPEKPPPVRPKPNLVVHKVRVVRPGQNFVFFTSHREELFVLPIENCIPGSNAGGIMASLRFHRGSDLIGKSDRAYWYEKSEHEISLERNETQEVVLGKYKDGRWHYFANPTRHIHAFRRPYREPDPPESFALDKPVVMIVEVFSPYSSDEAYVHGRYLIAPTMNGCEIEEAP